MSGTTNAPYVGIKVWGSNGTQNSLASNSTATAGDTSNAQTAGYKISAKFKPQPNGTPIHFQVIGYLGANAVQAVNATPVNVVANCVDPNATPSPTPAASITPAPSPAVSAAPVASPTTPAAPQTNQPIPWWQKIWQRLMKLLGR